MPSVDWYRDVPASIDVDLTSDSWICGQEGSLGHAVAVSTDAESPACLRALDDAMIRYLENAHINAATGRVSPGTCDQDWRPRRRSASQLTRLQSCRPASLQLAHHRLSSPSVPVSLPTAHSFDSILALSCPRSAYLPLYLGVDHGEGDIGQDSAGPIPSPCQAEHNWTRNESQPANHTVASGPLVLSRSHSGHSTDATTVSCAGRSLDPRVELEWDPQVFGFASPVEVIHHAYLAKEILTAPPLATFPWRNAAAPTAASPDQGRRGQMHGKKGKKVPQRALEKDDHQPSSRSPPPSSSSFRRWFGSITYPVPLAHLSSHGMDKGRSHRQPRSDPLPLQCTSMYHGVPDIRSKGRAVEREAKGRHDGSYRSNIPNKVTPTWLQSPMYASHFAKIG